MLTAGSYWLERRWRAMGTTVHLQVGGAHEPLVEWAVHELEHLEHCWSRFRPDSELCRLMAAPAGSWVPVSADLLRALVAARTLWERTAGCFDPTICGALEALGYDRTFALVDPVGAAPAPATRRPVPAGFGAVELDEDRRQVRLPDGVRLDLGGVGKGLAADLLADGLVQRGASAALVSIGGDIRTAGEPPSGGWLVPVQDPFDPSHTWQVVALGEEAIVTSTSLIRRWRRGDQQLHHILDPLTGRPTDTGVVAVVARGPEAWWAEGLAKAVMVLGEEAAPALLEGTGVGATLFRDDGTSRTIDAEGAPCSAR